jgi:ketosteroid isomerase-like protein
MSRRRQMVILFKNPKLLFAAALLGPAGLLQGQGDSIDSLPSLWKAELSFAQMSVEKGVRDAFLACLGEDATVFDPGPTNGRKLWEKRPPSTSQLRWHPIFADVARAGDLGYTTGPWEYRKDPDDAKASSYGQFVSIWKRQKDDSWKVVLDIGVDTPAPAGVTDTWQLPSPTPAMEEPRDLKTSRRALGAAEESFAKAARKDAGAALIRDAHNDIRVFRSGKLPAVGRDAARLMLDYDHGKMKSEKLGGAFSRSGDLGFSYGKYSTERLDGTEHGYFVTIWRQVVGGDWRIAVDVHESLPAKKTAEKTP